MNDYHDLFQTILTTTDRDDWLDYLTKTKAWIYTQSEARDDIEKDSKYQLLKELIDINKLGHNDSKNLEITISGLEKQLQGIKILKLTLCFNPDRKMLREILIKMQQVLADTFILDIDIDKKILGGSVIEFEGKYYDRSLQRKIDGFLIDHKEAISNLLK